LLDINTIGRPSTVTVMPSAALDDAVVGCELQRNRVVASSPQRSMIGFVLW